MGPAPPLRWAGCCCLGSAHLHLEHPIPRHAFSATRSSDSAATPGEQASARAWAQFWAHSPPVRHRSPMFTRSCSRSWRTVADAGERHATVLESVRPQFNAGRGPSATWVQGYDRVRPDTRQLTNRITLSDREVRGERAPNRLIASLSFSGPAVSGGRMVVLSRLGCSLLFWHGPDLASVLGACCSFPGEAPAQVGSLAARTSTGLMSGGAASSSSARCSRAAAIGPSR